jgi:hypothetical protein
MSVVTNRADGTNYASVYTHPLLKFFFGVGKI